MQVEQLAMDERGSWLNDLAPKYEAQSLSLWSRGKEELFLTKNIESQTQTRN